MPKRVAAMLLTAALITAPAQAQPAPEASQAQDLSNCAGAVAAFANLNIMAYPQSSNGAWSLVLGEILTALNREPGGEGMTGRYAANAARAFWQDRPRAEQETAANQCRARFGSQ